MDRLPREILEHIFFTFLGRRDRNQLRFLNEGYRRLITSMRFNGTVFLSFDRTSLYQTVKLFNTIITILLLALSALSTTATTGSKT